MKIQKKEELLKALRHGRRLNTKPPKKEVPKSVYTRKAKHKRKFDESSYAPCFPAYILSFISSSHN
ncbi:MAG TPA: hypothetical protein PK859_03275 [Spirochaetota bacterium]|nr:hypothetical protein [Spirochaetota bacterium]HPR47769.1 hypothetical protein [Spirochaetota bacterium]